MKRNNDYLIKTFSLIDKLQVLFDIQFDSNDKYNSIIQSLKGMSSKVECIEKADTFKLDKEIRKDIEDYLYSMNIVKFKKKVGNFNQIMLTGYAIEDENEIPEEELSVLKDIYLIRYLASFLQTISYVQKDNLLLVKYNKSIWNFGYNNLTNICRGKVLDVNTKEIISYPFDKFFNLDECEETAFDKMDNLLAKAKYIYAMDKADGSTITITKTINGIVINTNGEFDNIQVDLAKKLLVEKYQKFLSKMEIGYTYVFELIHPKDSKVVDYNGAKKLLLLAVRDLKDKRLFRYDECVKIALELGLEVVDCFEFTSLKEFVHMSHTLEGSNREGWVIRVITDDEDIMFKLKIDEYCILHRSILGKVNPYHIYELMKTDMLDDVIAKSDEGTKILILDMVEQINNILLSIEESLRTSLQLVQANFDITQEEFQDCLKNRQNPKYKQRLELIGFIHKNCRELLDFEGITAYYKHGKSVEEFIKSIDVIRFKRLGRDKQLFKEVVEFPV